MGEGSGAPQKIWKPVKPETSIADGDAFMVTPPPKLEPVADALDAWRKAEAEWPREGVVRWVDVTAKELLEGESDG